MGLPPFNPTPVCPKCWNGGVSSNYHDPKTKSFRSCHERAEHIHRSCHRCGYDWAEAPLDAKAAEGGSTAEP